MVRYSPGFLLWRATESAKVYLSLQWIKDEERVNKIKGDRLWMSCINDIWTGHSGIIKHLLAEPPGYEDLLKSADQRAYILAR